MGLPKIYEQPLGREKREQPFFSTSLFFLRVFTMVEGVEKLD
jgi:hypothetical protein